MHRITIPPVKGDSLIIQEMLSNCFQTSSTPIVQVTSTTKLQEPAQYREDQQLRPTIYMIVQEI